MFFLVICSNLYIAVRDSLYKKAVFHLQRGQNMGTGITSAVTDCSAFLTDAIKAIEELNRSKKACEDLEAEEEQIDKELEQERLNMADTINQTVKKRRDGISASYDKEIGTEQDRLRKIRAKREKAKNQGIKERIAEETKELKEKNQELSMQLKTLFKQNRVPSFCKTTWFYAFYMPGSLKELGLLILGFLVCFVGIPLASYLFIPEENRKFWVMVIIYLIVILIFGGLYILVGNKVKMRHLAVLKQGKDIRGTIRGNNRKIRAITSSIRKDRDEAIYNLEKYDDEISQIEQELQQLSNQKKEALNAFNTVTKTIISDEIMNNNKVKMEALEEEHARIEARLKEAQIHAKEQALLVTDQYETYLGKEFLQPDKLSELAKIVRGGRASNLSEAIAVYQAQKNG